MRTFFSETLEKLCKRVALEATLDKPDKDGNTLRQMYKSIIEQGGTGKLRDQAERELTPAPLNGIEQMLMNTYIGITNTTRSVGHHGLNATSLHDIDVWQRFNNVVLAPKVVRAVLSIDRAYINELYARE